jgi:hypothetical protein
MLNFSQTSPDPYVRTSAGIFIPRTMLPNQTPTVGARPEGEPTELVASGETRQQRRRREQQLADATKRYLAVQQASADIQRRKA